MKLLTEDLNRLPKLLVGFITMSFGIMLIKESNLGLFAWGVFHDGISNVTPLSFGQVIQVLGLVIVVFSVLAFKTNVGIGTFLNIILVGWMIDYTGELFPFTANTIYLQILFMTVGIIVMNIGRAFYISARLGAGPRDGLFVGLSRITQIDVKYVKPGIEVIVLAVGYGLGGIIGVGTFITMFFSGYMVQYFFKQFGFDPKQERQSSITEYFKVTKKAH